MTDDRPSPLEMRWVPVTDASGRTHMEAVWVVTVTSPASTDLGHAA